MIGYFIFLTAADTIIAVQNHPKAIDSAPYEIMAKRCHGGKLVDTDTAKLYVMMFGGRIIGA